MCKSSQAKNDAIPSPETAHYVISFPDWSVHRTNLCWLSSSLGIEGLLHRLNLVGV